MGVRRVEWQLAIEARAQDCFDALTDYRSFPDWQGPIRGVDVLECDGDGRGREVAYKIDARVKTVRYTLRYGYEEPRRITFELVEGDVKAIHGEYVFEDEGDGTTLATYSLAVDPGVWVPGALAKALSEQSMKGVLRDLKRRVESR